VERWYKLMAKVDTNQTNFSGGEFAPSLLGRTDIAQYANACAIVENFLLRPYGPAISTPGTEFINACKTGGSTSITRLLQFVFSRTDSYIIEMGVGYFRFYTDGSVVVSPGTTPYEVAHTYTATEIPEIQYCQLNDIIFLAHKNHRLQKLIRYSSTSWGLVDFDFVGGPFLDDNTTAITITPSATAGTITITVTPTNSNLFIPSSSTIGHLNSYWKIGQPITSSTTGLSEQGYVKITAIANSYTATATVIKNLKDTAATSDWAEGSWSSVNGYPSRLTFHQQRLFLARTDQEPLGVWGSRPFIYDDFSVEIGNDDHAIDIELAADETNDIKWLVSGRALIAGTFGGAFVIKSGDGSPLTPANTTAFPEVNVGSEAIVPKRIGSFFYFIQRFGKKLREMFYLWDNDAYKAVDKTILSPHISGGGFVEMAYQQNPDTVLWCVCSNGTLATMTREIDQEVQGWSRQTTDGLYESVATIPSIDEDHDEVWVVVNRTIGGATKRYIERFKSQRVPDRQDKCFYVHSGLSYDAFEATATSTASSLSLAATAGTMVIVTCSTTRFSAGDVGQRVRAIDSVGGILGELEITNVTSGTIASGIVKYPFSALAYSAGYWGISVDTISGLDHLETKTVSVLGDGGTDKPNKVVSNGTITLAYNYFVVTAGLPYTQKITTLPQEDGSQKGTSQGKVQRINQVGFKVNRSHKGFQVGGEATELDTVTYAEALDSEVLYTGTIPNTDFKLEKVVFRDPTTLLGTPELLYTGVIPNISFRGDYKYGAQVVLENSDPLPIELLSLMTNLDTQDKA
jgi:hypothetical protein